MNPTDVSDTKELRRNSNGDSTSSFEYFDVLGAEVSNRQKEKSNPSASGRIQDAVRVTLDAVRTNPLASKLGNNRISGSSKWSRRPSGAPLRSTSMFARRETMPGIRSSRPHETMISPPQQKPIDFNFKEFKPFVNPAEQKEKIAEEERKTAALARAKEKMRSAFRALQFANALASDFIDDSDRSRVSSSSSSEAGDMFVDFPINRHAHVEERERLRDKCDPEPISRTHDEADQRRPWRATPAQKIDSADSVYSEVSAACALEEEESAHIRTKSFGNEFGDSGQLHAGRRSSDMSDLSEEGDDESHMSDLRQAQEALGWKSDDLSECPVSVNRGLARKTLNLNVATRHGSSWNKKTEGRVSRQWSQEDDLLSITPAQDTGSVEELHMQIDEQSTSDLSTPKAMKSTLESCSKSPTTNAADNLVLATPHADKDKSPPSNYGPRQGSARHELAQSLDRTLSRRSTKSHRKPSIHSHDKYRQSRRTRDRTTMHTLRPREHEDREIVQTVLPLQQTDDSSITIDDLQEYSSRRTKTGRRSKRKNAVKQADKQRIPGNVESSDSVVPDEDRAKLAISHTVSSRSHRRKQRQTGSKGRAKAQNSPRLRENEGDAVDMQQERDSSTLSMGVHSARNLDSPNWSASDPAKGAPEIHDYDADEARDEFDVESVISFRKDDARHFSAGGRGPYRNVSTRLASSRVSKGSAAGTIRHVRRKESMGSGAASVRSFRSLFGFNSWAGNSEISDGFADYEDFWYEDAPQAGGNGQAEKEVAGQKGVTPGRMGTFLRIHRWKLVACVLLVIVVIVVSITAANASRGDSDNPTAAPTPLPTSPPTPSPTPGQPEFTESQVLLGIGENDFAGFAVSFSTDGGYLAVGYRGASGATDLTGGVQVFGRVDGALTPYGSMIYGSSSGDEFGTAVAISDDGQSLIVGARRNSASGRFAGAAAVYQYSTVFLDWEQVGDTFFGTEPNARLGFAVSISGDGKTIAVGAPRANSDAGTVSVYEIDEPSATWIQLGQTLQGARAGELVGYSLSLSGSGDRLAIGALRSSQGDVANCGRISVYSLVEIDGGGQPSLWQPIGNDILGESQGDQLGQSLALTRTGDRIAVGANGQDSSSGGENVGACHVFMLQAGLWYPVGAALHGEVQGEQFGFSVSISDDGDRLACGGAKSSVNGEDSGVVRLYDEREGQWTQIGNDQIGLEGSQFGTSVSFSGDGVSFAAGGPRLAFGRKSNVGLVQVYEESM